MPKLTAPDQPEDSPNRGRPDERSLQPLAGNIPSPRSHELDSEPSAYDDKTGADQGRWHWDGTQFVPADGDSAAASQPTWARKPDQTVIPAADSDPQLGELLGFTTSELEANRDGRMTMAQRLRSAVRAIWRLVLAALIVPVAVLIAFGGYDLLAIVISVLASMVALYVGWRSFSFASDAAHGWVSVASGVLDKQKEYEWRSTQFYVLIGELKTRVRGAVYEKLAAGTALRAYYSPGAAALLSVEPDSNASPTPARPYGPRTARDFPRWAQLIALLALGGILLAILGLHIFVQAQPAAFTTISGPIWGETQSAGGRTTSYYVWISGYPDSYELRTGPEGFSPRLPDLSRQISVRAYLYVNQQDGKVAAVYLDRLYSTDIYSDPRIQERSMKAAGAAALFFAFLLLLPLLVMVAIQLVTRLPQVKKNVKPIDTYSVDSPEVAAAIERIQELPSSEWERLQIVEPLGIKGMGLLSQAEWQALARVADKAPAFSRFDTFLGHRAIGAVAFHDRLRPRDFIAMYGPLLDAIPPETIGIKWPMADLVERDSYEPLVMKFRAAVNGSRGGHRTRAELPDTTERIEAGICLAALAAEPDERSRLAQDLVELAGFQHDSAEAKIATVQWLGESESTARKAEYAGGDPTKDLARHHSEQGLVSSLGCYVSLDLLIYGGIVAVYMWVTVGDIWGGWVALGLAAAVTPAVGAIVYHVIFGRVPGRSALVLAVAATLGAPAAVLLAGWSQIHNPVSIGTLAVAAPTLVAFIAWLSLRHPHPVKTA